MAVSTANQRQRQQATQRWISEVFETYSPSTIEAPLTGTSQQNCHLLVIPENGTIDVASTPAIPEEEPWDPPLSSGSVTRLGAADTVKDWPQLETKLECFPSDLEMPRAVKKLEILLAEQSNGQL